MGSFCSRRLPQQRQEYQTELLEADPDADWLVIRPTGRLRSLQWAVKKVTQILQLRKTWSKLGKWLSARDSQSSPHRAVLKAVWYEMSQAICKKYKLLFSHLARQDGRLMYKTKAGLQRSF